MIYIDLAARTLDVEVAARRAAARRADLAAARAEYQRGWLARYTRLVTNASNGAVLEVAVTVAVPSRLVITSSEAKTELH